MRPLRGQGGSPGPSRTAYRLRRAWAQAWVRSAVTVYLPLAALALAGWAVVSTDRLRLALRAEVEALAERVAARPEFTVRGVEIEGASEALAAELRGLVGPVRGRSSLRLDLDALRTEIERLGAVASASVFFDPRGTLAVRVVERLPAALWRDPAGALRVLDRAGVVIGPAAHRGAHPRLPLLLGIGAPARVGEALALMRAAPALVPRLRAFARIGERRWDVVLDREMRVMLPEEGAARALKGAMALQFGEELFERDLVAVDLRLPDRPVLRLHPRAAEGDVLRRAVDLVLGEET